MAKRVLMIRGLSKSFAGIKALDEVSLSVDYGEILGLIGPNGAGKTTLFNVISGFLAPNSGKAVFQGTNLLKTPSYRIAEAGIARTFQNLRLIRQLSVLDNVLLSFRDQPGESLGNVFFRWKKSKQREVENRETALSLLEETGLGEKANDPADDLSYGQQKLLSLVCCLAAKADLLLLDEPVAGIAPEMREKILAIIKRLPQQNKSVVIIEHDTEAITSVCDRVIFMDAGQKICEGMPEEVRNDPRVIEAYLE